MAAIRTVVATLVAASLAIPAVAAAQSELRLSVLGLNKDHTDMLVRVHDAEQGTLLQVRQVQTDKVKKGWFVENKNDERRRVKMLTRSRFPVEASVDQQDPKGRYTVLGAPDQLKKDYEILIMRDGRIGVLGSIPIKRSENGKEVAKAMLKEVVWTPDGNLVIAVVNQKLKQQNGTDDVDTLHYFRFRPWKVKWIKPEGAEESGGEETEP